ncbi:MAG TPA: bacillithiol biosynthesis cysteine-adding enzyme BshC [Granulicella sp.]
MSTECYPITMLPHVSRLYREYLAMSERAADAPVRRWYGAEPLAGRWIGKSLPVAGDASALADALEQQSREFGAGPAAMENISRLRSGARVVVTGQQVGLFGGPLLTLLKAATSVARAKQATATTGIEHVPVFWLATEDHDLPEVDHVALPGKTSVETVKAHMTPHGVQPVGAITLGAEMEAALDQASELLGWAPVSELLRECYSPREWYTPTLGGAFARLMARLFADEGLIVMDASSRTFHALGASTLRAAIERADELHGALAARTAELAVENFHSQVLVAEGSSLLFLITDAGERLALKRLPEGGWKAGRHPVSTEELLAILATEPERISPNALLRPVFQDTILPTAAYIGGPAEVAYFAQSAVLYEKILGRITPVLPRLSATLIEPSIAEVMAQHEVSLPDAMTTTDALAQRLGARAMPIEGKRKLAAVGNAMDAELTALIDYMTAMDESLGRSASVAGSKMRYQMNRLRRMAATFELQKESSLRKHAQALTLHLFPEGHPQERLFGGVWFVARVGEGLIARLVKEAANLCPGHIVIRL